MIKDSLLLKKELSSLVYFNEFRSSMEIHLSRFSSETHEMLDSFFRRIHKCQKAWENSILQNQIMTTFRVLSPAELNQKLKSDDYMLIPLLLRRSIHETCQKFHVVCYHFSNRSYYFHICAPLKTKNSEFKNIIHQTYLWLCFVNEFVDSKCGGNINIFLFMISNEKSLPKHHDQLIDKEHVNTAFTYSCKPQNDIYIFRAEEWYRALIHETFHTLGVDFIRLGHDIIKKQQDKIKTIFPVSVQNLHLYETYCEMWAEIMNVMFYTYAHQDVNASGRLPLITWKKDFMEHMFWERAFTCWQCSKLLKHFNIEYEDLNKKKVAETYKEKTPAFSYYVLKCILSVHLNQFLHFCAIQYENKYSVQFRLTETNLSKYIHIFENLYDSPAMLYGTRFMSYSLYQKRGKPFYNNLRMSLIQNNI